MKNLIPVFLMVVLSLSACKTDVCDGVVCENGGTCEDGLCDCPDGYVGAQCEIPLDACDLKNCDATGTDTCLISTVTGEANCLCSDGYEGERCEARWEEKFAGNYQASESCDGIGGNFLLTIELGPDPGEVTLVNFANEQPNSIPAKIVCDLLTSTAFQIGQQYMPFGEVEGQGGIRSDGSIEYSYTVITNGDTASCIALLTPS